MTRDQRHLLYGLSTDSYSPRGLWLLGLLYFGSLLAAVFLSLAAWKITHFVDPDGSSYLASKPYTKFFDRSRWFCVLLILPFLFWRCRITSYPAAGFIRPFPKTAATWFAYGIGMIAIIYASSAAFGAIQLKSDASAAGFVSNLGNAMLAGILVGLLEEIVFRGLVFRMFYTALKPLPAIILSSVFFAILHFKASAEAFTNTSPQEIGLYEGFHTAWAMMAALVTEFDFTYLASIFLVGVLLHQVFLLTSNLWASAALHAGWVFTIKAVGGGFETSSSANAFTGTTRVADGYLVILVLIVFCAIFAWKLPSKTATLEERKVDI